MKKIIRLTESDLVRLVNEVISEQQASSELDYFMKLGVIKNKLYGSQWSKLLSKPKDVVEEIAWNNAFVLPKGTYEKYAKSSTGPFYGKMVWTKKGRNGILTLYISSKDKNIFVLNNPEVGTRKFNISDEGQFQNLENQL
jgi:hypothetical protein